MSCHSVDKLDTLSTGMSDLGMLSNGTFEEDSVTLIASRQFGMQLQMSLTYFCNVYEDLAYLLKI